MEPEACVIEMRSTPKVPMTSTGADSSSRVARLAESRLGWAWRAFPASTPSAPF
jgi:hypothetical protein